jgi:hypothetical protein
MPVRPPKLTRKEFLRKVPTNPVQGRSAGQRYQSYLTAYQRKFNPVRQQSGQRPLPTIESLLSRVGQFETPAQLEARANRMAGAGIKQQQTMIREEAALMRKEAQDRALSMAAAGRAAAAQNAGLFGMVGGEYNAAAGEIANLGTNMSNQMVHTTEADTLAQNAGLATVGAPEMAVGGPAGSNTIAGPTQGGVSAYQFGTLPAQAITRAGEASQFGLAGMVAAQNLRATQEANAGFIQATRDADRSRAAAMKELAAGRPAEAAKFLQMLQEAQRQQIGLASGLIQQRAGMRQAGFEQGMTRKTFKETKKQQAIENQRAAAEMAMKAQAFAIDLSAVDPVKSQALGYVVNKQGQPILKNGKRIPAKKLLDAMTSSTKKKGGRSLTPGQRVSLMEKAQEAMENAYYGYTNVDGKRVPITQSGDFDPNNPETYGSATGQQTYSRAVQRLVSMGVQPAWAKQLAAQYYQPGEGGRPILTPAQRKLLAKKLGPAEANRIINSIQQQLQTSPAAAQHRLAELYEVLGQ